MSNKRIMKGSWAALSKEILPSEIKYKLPYPKEEMDRLQFDVKKTRISPYQDWGEDTYELEMVSPPQKYVKEVVLPSKYGKERDERYLVDEGLVSFKPTKDKLRGNVYGGNIKIKDKRYSLIRNFKELTKEGKDEEYLWRGMSSKEWEDTQKRGYVKSKGEYNLSNQQGLTYFSVNPRQARSYAAGFTPWTLIPTWKEPAVVVRVKKPEHSRLELRQGSDEVGVSGSVPISDIDKVYEIRVAAEKPGYLDIIVDKRTGKACTGSQCTPSQHYAVRDVPKGEWGTFLEYKSGAVPIKLSMAPTTSHKAKSKARGISTKAGMVR